MKPRTRLILLLLLLALTIAAAVLVQPDDTPKPKTQHFIRYAAPTPNFPRNNRFEDTVPSEAREGKWLLTTIVGGHYSAGTISIAPDGVRVVTGLISYLYPKNALVTLRANPASGCRFDHWSINGIGWSSSPTVSLVLQSDMRVKAFFFPVYRVDAVAQVVDFARNVVPDAEGGAVWPRSGDIDEDTVLHFEATAFPDHRFLGWSGDLDGSAARTTLRVDGPKRVVARFVRTWRLRRDTRGPGTATVTPDAVSYDDGAPVVLLATPNSRMWFDHWEIRETMFDRSPLTVKENPATVAMTGHKFVTAVFAEPRTLTVVIEPPGAGIVTPGSGQYPLNSLVRLHAVPNENYLFDHWEGTLPWGPDKALDTNDVRMDDKQFVHALFVERPGVAELDILRDFAVYLSVIGASESIETYDKNEFDYDGNANRVITGNGMPDAAEMRVVEEVLKRPALFLINQSYLSHEYMWETWSVNLAQAKQDVRRADLPPSVNADAIARVVAGYSLLGSFPSQAAAEMVLQRAFPGFSLTESGYRNGGMRYFVADEDADNDGDINKEEWDALGGHAWAERVNRYADAAVDPRINARARQKSVKSR